MEGQLETAHTHTQRTGSREGAVHQDWDAGQRYPLPDYTALDAFDMQPSPVAAR